VKHLADDFEVVKVGLAAAVAATNLVLISGGVSQGLFDHVPRALEEIGVKKILHRVAQKPGKPLWFGVHPSGAAVFGLPGNPVSTLVCFHRYVRPWLRRVLGAEPEPETTAKLTATTRGPAPLTGFLPARLRSSPDGHLEATALPYHGSGDLASLGESDGFIEIDATQPTVPAGQSVRFHPWAASSG
jgi:molybdopterin molybdotransferase